MSPSTYKPNSLKYLAVLLLLVPALLPQGMMLTRNSVLGQVEITMCAGIGERNVWLDLETGSFSDEPVLAGHSPEDDDDHANVNQLCSFAVVSVLALPQNPSVGSGDSVRQVQHSGVTQNPIIRRFPGGHLPPRGPPSVS
ncbi:MAG: hypothetical protein ACI9OF_001506 [Saprospiraceae bacterium]|jgi:hypothetical protein